MATEPQTRYLETEQGRLAYHVIAGGAGGHVIWCQEINQHLDLVWTDPTIASTISGLARDQLTSVMFQPRGTGLSDPVSRRPTVEEQAADVLAIMDAEGIEHAVLAGIFSTGLAAALVAAQRPERVDGLVLHGVSLTGPTVSDTENGWTPTRARTCADGYRRVLREWGSGLAMQMWEPALCTPYNLRLMGMVERCAGPPELIAQFVDHWINQDGREIYPQVRVPTRVLRQPGQAYPDATVRAVADAIEGATYHELPPAALGDSFGSMWSHITRHIAEVARGEGALTGTPDRVLATVLFTDIVGSTDHLARVGDTAWTSMLAAHEQLVRREVTKAGGSLVSTAGDGTLCEFAGPAAAVHCAQALTAACAEMGIEIRAGIHTGECERRGEDLAGLAVHIGARVGAQAEPGEVLVSRTVRDLVAGSGMAFASRGERQFKGVPGTWEVFAAGATEATPLLTPAPSPATPLDRVAVKLARRSPATMRAAVRLGHAVQRRRMRAA